MYALFYEEKVQYERSKRPTRAERDLEAFASLVELNPASQVDSVHSRTDEHEL